MPCHGTSSSDESQQQTENVTKHATHNALGLTIIFSFTQRDHLFVLVPAIAFSCLCGLIKPTLSILIGRYLTSLSKLASPSADMPAVTQQNWTTICQLVGLAAFTWLSKTGFAATWDGYAEVQVKVVREDLFKTLLDRDLEWFDKQDSGIGSLLIRLQTHIKDFQHGVSRPVGLALTAIVQLLGALIVAFIYNWRLSLAILAALPVLALIISLLGIGSQKRIQEQQIQSSQATKQANHALRNIVFVISSNMRTEESTRYVDILKVMSQRFRRHMVTLSAQEGVSKFATTAMIVLSLFYGTHLVHHANATPGSIITTFQCCTILSASFSELLNQFLQLQKGCAAALTLRGIINRVERGEASHDRAVGRTPAIVDGDIEFRSVSFAYPSRPENMVLDDVSLFFPAHEITFVVGRSGSGKSTLAALLLSLYRPDRGTVYLDGHKLPKLETEWLRNNITLVQQDSFLFKDTIAGNIGISNCQNSLRQPTSVEDCVAFAALSRTIDDLPAGLGTFIGQGGASLSGGQRQRVALARARFRDSPILILDESTSALDETSKATIMHNIRVWRQDKTTIIVTHDMSHIQPGDFVYALRNGRVCADGYYEDIHSIIKAMVSEAPDYCETASKIDTLQTEPHLRSDRRLRPGFQRSHSVASTIDDGADRDGRPSPASSQDNLLNMSYDTEPSSRRTLAKLAPLRKILPSRGRSPAPTIRRDHSKDLTAQSLELTDLKEARRLQNRLTMVTAYKHVTNRPHILAATTIEEQIVSETLAERTTIIWKEATKGGSSTPIPLPFSDFEAQWRPMSSLQILRTILSFLNSRDLWLLFVALLLNAISAASPASSSLVMVEIFSTFTLQDDWLPKAQKWSGVLALIALADGLLMFAVNYLVLTRTEIWSFSMRSRLFSTLLQQPKSWFDRQEFSADETGRLLDNGPNDASVLLSGLVRPAETIFVMTVFAAVVSLVKAWKFSLIVFAHGFFFLGIGKLYSWISARWESKKFAASEQVAESFSETFSDIKTVRALTLQSRFHERYLKAVSNALNVGQRRAVYTGMCYGLSECSVMLVAAPIFDFAFHMVRKSPTTVHAILNVLAVLLLTLMNISVISSLIPSVATGVAAGNRVMKLMKLRTVVATEIGVDIEERAFRGNIKFHNLTFSYPGRLDSVVLRNLTLDIPEGQCLSIVGSSGAGKSTIIQLLLGLYPVSGRKLTISDHDITELDLTSLRSKIAYVPQQPVVLPMAVRANIAYGLDEDAVTEDVVISAARTAGIHDFITSLPNGYDTMIGEAGQGVSGGQAQRIALARAFARQPKILLMDEPTSALDQISANIVKRSIRELAKAPNAPTIIIVTHSRDMMQLTDRTVVLKQGTIVEDGNFVELYNQQGAVWRLLSGSAE